MKYRLPGNLPPDLKLQINTDRVCDENLILSLDLKCGPAQSQLELCSFSAEFKPGFSSDVIMMANGFQSWSRSEELGIRDQIKPLFPLARPLLAQYGDYSLKKYSGKRGHLHSWNYTYFRRFDGRVLFLGSLDERSGYTCFDYDFHKNRLRISKDCAGTIVNTGCSLMTLFIGSGKQDQLFKRYFELFGREPVETPKISGWCSWYNYYHKITESIILENLNSIKLYNIPVDVFQIDDGWQQAIGDWLQANGKFPAGMKSLADRIDQDGFRPGLWLAPLICTPDSKVYKDHPQWLLRDQKGRPVKAGFNPGWGGFFYALNFYADGVREYLDEVFYTVQEEWGYRMLKLDFLYAAALLPHEGRTRGGIMAEVIDYLESVTENSIVIGCGVPLAPAFSQFEYCRIGSDVAPYWDNYLKKLHYRERVSTENSLACIIGRKNLDRLFFRNDPDVFILRDGVKGVNENKLTGQQRNTLFLLNNLLGGLIFFSDNPNELSADQLKQLLSAYPLVETENLLHQHNAGLHCFDFKIKNNSYQLYANLSAEIREITVKGSYFFHPDNFLVPPGTLLSLKPFESACLYRIEKSERDFYLLGATGHLFPGAQIDRFETDIDRETVLLSLHRSAAPDTVVYLALPIRAGSITVNNQSRLIMEKDGIRYARVDNLPLGVDRP